MTIHERSMCGQIGSSHIGREVSLAGWVDALRDHGEVLFIHLRDRSGIVQVVFGPESTERTVCRQAALLKMNTASRSPVGCCAGPPYGKPEYLHRRRGGGGIGADHPDRSKTPPFPISEKSMLAGICFCETTPCPRDCDSSIAIGSAATFHAGSSHPAACHQQDHPKFSG
jgi:aspartyl-tRNA synthetase